MPQLVDDPWHNYVKRIMFKYMETLIALGDQLFQQTTPETTPLAIQRLPWSLLPTDCLSVFGCSMYCWAIHELKLHTAPVPAQIPHQYRSQFRRVTSRKSIDDPRFRTDNIPIKAIVIGSPTANSAAAGTGSFSFDFPRDRYSPFEGAGDISTWQIKLPPTFRQFDYRTISDVVLQLRYTAMDAGDIFG
ncbi:hypothetical protein GGR55DRAFT_681964 [Xylaria sp. FL0064]|nr:hypothetical protein GGR55DRAFT_681964 [Xylaria sp. FL0064]